jgi:hypothetical protein
VACGLDEPSATEGADWLGDERLVVVALPYDALDGIAEPDLVVLDATTTYRLRSVRPKTSFAAGRRLLATESRESGGAA